MVVSFFLTLRSTISNFSDFHRQIVPPLHDHDASQMVFLMRNSTMDPKVLGSSHPTIKDQSDLTKDKYLIDTTLILGSLFEMDHSRSNSSKFVGFNTDRSTASVALGISTSEISSLENPSTPLPILSQNPISRQACHIYT
jgi:hypothetical protein